MQCRVTIVTHRNRNIAPLPIYIRVWLAKEPEMVDEAVIAGARIVNYPSALIE